MDPLSKKMMDKDEIKNYKYESTNLSTQYSKGLDKFSKEIIQRDLYTNASRIMKRNNADLISFVSS